MKREIFEQAVREHQDMVFRVALHCFANRQDAEDTVQEVFLRLYGRQEPFESPEHLRRWLVRVTINESKRMLLSPWRRTESLELLEDRAALPEENRELFRAVMALPEKYRVAMYLYYYEGYSTEELAKLLKISGSTVRTRLRRGRAQLKESLGGAENV